MKRMNTPKVNHYTRKHKDWKGDGNDKVRKDAVKEIKSELENKDD